MRDETSKLLATLHDLDLDIVEIMVGLLTGELSTEKQRQFARQCATAGRLLEQHAELTQEPEVHSGDTTDMA